MLSSFTIEKFKSYRGASELKLAPLTVLIGANAAGKSNAIEALRLLSWIAAGNRLGTIRHALQEQERTVRGGIVDIAFRGAPSFSFSCQTTDPDWNRYSITLETRENEELHIAGERLTGSGRSSAVPLFEVVEPSEGHLGDMYVAYNNFARGGKKPRILCSDQTAVLCQLMNPAPFYYGHKTAQEKHRAGERERHRRAERNHTDDSVPWQELHGHVSRHGPSVWTRGIPQQESERPARQERRARGRNCPARMGRGGTPRGPRVTRTDGHLHVGRNPVHPKTRSNWRSGDGGTKQYSGSYAPRTTRSRKP